MLLFCLIILSQFLSVSCWTLESLKNIRAITYAPSSITEIPPPALKDLYTATQSLIHERDLSLIQASGANTVRLMGYGFDESIDHTPFLDLCASKSIKVILPFLPFYGLPARAQYDVSDLLRPALIQNIENRFTKFVNRYQNHSSTLAYMIFDTVPYQMNQLKYHVELSNRLIKIRDLNCKNDTKTLCHPISLPLGPSVDQTISDLLSYLHTVDHSLVDPSTGLIKLSPHAAFDFYFLDWTGSADSGLDLIKILRRHRELAKSHAPFLIQFGFDSLDMRINDGESNETSQSKSLLNFMHSMNRADPHQVLGVVVNEWSDQWWRARLFNKPSMECARVDSNDLQSQVEKRARMRRRGDEHEICGFSITSNPLGRSNKKQIIQTSDNFINVAWLGLNSQVLGDPRLCIQPKEGLFNLAEMWTKRSIKNVKDLMDGSIDNQSIDCYDEGHCCAIRTSRLSDWLLPLIIFALICFVLLIWNRYRNRHDNQSNKQLNTQSNNQSINQSSDQAYPSKPTRPFSLNQTMIYPHNGGQSVNQSINQSINQSVWSVNQSNPHQWLHTAAIANTNLLALFTNMRTHVAANYPTDNQSISQSNNQSLLNKQSLDPIDKKSLDLTDDVLTGPSLQSTSQPLDESLEAAAFRTNNQSITHPRKHSDNQSISLTDAEAVFRLHQQTFQFYRGWLQRGGRESRLQLTSTFKQFQTMYQANKQSNNQSNNQSINQIIWFACCDLADYWLAWIQLSHFKRVPSLVAYVFHNRFNQSIKLSNNQSNNQSIGPALDLDALVDRLNVQLESYEATYDTIEDLFEGEDLTFAARMKSIAMGKSTFSQSSSQSDNQPIHQSIDASSHQYPWPSAGGWSAMILIFWSTIHAHFLLFVLLIDMIHYQSISQSTHRPNDPLITEVLGQSDYQPSNQGLIDVGQMLFSEYGTVVLRKLAIVDLYLLAINQLIVWLVVRSMPVPSIAKFLIALCGLFLFDSIPFLPGFQSISLSITQSVDQSVYESIYQTFNQAGMGATLIHSLSLTMGLVVTFYWLIRIGLTLIDCLRGADKQYQEEDEEVSNQSSEKTTEQSNDQPTESVFQPPHHTKHYKRTKCKRFGHSAFIFLRQLSFWLLVITIEILFDLKVLWPSVAGVSVDQLCNQSARQSNSHFAPSLPWYSFPAPVSPILQSVNQSLLIESIVCPTFVYSLWSITFVMSLCTSYVSYTIVCSIVGSIIPSIKQSINQSKSDRIVVGVLVGLIVSLIVCLLVVGAVSVALVMGVMFFLVGCLFSRSHQSINQTSNQLNFSSSSPGNSQSNIQSNPSNNPPEIKPKKSSLFNRSSKPSNSQSNDQSKNDDESKESAPETAKDGASTDLIVVPVNNASAIGLVNHSVDCHPSIYQLMTLLQPLYAINLSIDQTIKVWADIMLAMEDEHLIPRTINQLNKHSPYLITPHTDLSSIGLTINQSASERIEELLHSLQSINQSSHHRVPSINQSRSITVLIPMYNETVINQSVDLTRDENDPGGLTIIEFLVHKYAEQFNYLVDDILESIVQSLAQANKPFNRQTIDKSAKQSNKERNRTMTLNRQYDCLPGNPLVKSANKPAINQPVGSDGLTRNARLVLDLFIAINDQSTDQSTNQSTIKHLYRSLGFSCQTISQSVNQTINQAIELWTSYRTQTLARTIRGMHNIRQALIDTAMYEYEQSNNQSVNQSNKLAQIERLVDSKFQVLVAAQIYSTSQASNQGNSQREALHRLMGLYPFLEIVYDFDQSKEIDRLVDWRTSIGKQWINRLINQPSNPSFSQVVDFVDRSRQPVDDLGPGNPTASQSSAQLSSSTGPPEVRLNARMQSVQQSLEKYHSLSDSVSQAIHQAVNQLTSMDCVSVNGHLSIVWRETVRLLDRELIACLTLIRSQPANKSSNLLLNRSNDESNEPLNQQLKEKDVGQNLTNYQSALLPTVCRARQVIADQIRLIDCLTHFENDLHHISHAFDHSNRLINQSNDQLDILFADPMLNQSINPSISQPLSELSMSQWTEQLTLLNEQQKQIESINLSINQSIIGSMNRVQEAVRLSNKQTTSRTVSQSALQTMVDLAAHLAGVDQFLHQLVETMFEEMKWRFIERISSSQSNNQSVNLSINQARRNAHKLLSWLDAVGLRSTLLSVNQANDKSMSISQSIKSVAELCSQMREQADYSLAESISGLDSWIHQKLHLLEQSSKQSTKVSRKLSIDQPHKRITSLSIDQSVNESISLLIKATLADIHSSLIDDLTQEINRSNKQSLSQSTNHSSLETNDFLSTINRLVSWIIQSGQSVTQSSKQLVIRAQSVRDESNSQSGNQSAVQSITDAINQMKTCLFEFSAVHWSVHIKRETGQSAMNRFVPHHLGAFARRSALIHGRMFFNNQSINQSTVPSPTTNAKSENQLHALSFARHELIQALDMNQDQSYDQSLKFRIVPTHFQYSATQKPRFVLIGISESIYTEDISAVGQFLATQDQCFVSLVQRTLNYQSIRLHYGHPDLIDGYWCRFHVGLSKASPGVNLSEDIFFGLDMLKRGAQSDFVESVQFGKGRETCLLNAVIFEDKLSRGAGQCVRTPDLYQSITQSNVLFGASLLYGSLGHFVFTCLFDWGISGFAWLVLCMSCANIDSERIGLLGSVLAIPWLFHLGFAFGFPLATELAYRRGVIASIVMWLHNLLCGGLFYLFQVRTKSCGLASSLSGGLATYRGTGRNIGLRRDTLRDLYVRYDISHFTHALRLFCVLGMYALMFSEEKLASTMLRLWAVVLACIAWLAAPAIFTPGWFTSNNQTNNQSIKQQWLELVHWRTSSSGWCQHWTSARQQEITQLALSMQSIKQANKHSAFQLNVCFVSFIGRCVLSCLPSLLLAACLLMPALDLLFPFCVYMLLILLLQVCAPQSTRRAWILLGVMAYTCAMVLASLEEHHGRAWNMKGWGMLIRTSRAKDCIRVISATTIITCALSAIYEAYHTSKQAKIMSKHLTVQSNTQSNQAIKPYVVPLSPGHQHMLNHPVFAPWRAIHRDVYVLSTGCILASVAYLCRSFHILHTRYLVGMKEKIWIQGRERRDAREFKTE